jgi:eukaryotic-like serine/threonine-protein kinase
MSMIGKTLAHYEITSQLGKGGMGEVYQAKDRKLGRDVAIKVLPEEFAKDADRIARFQREAKLLASLNHTNIAAIYGLEESSGTKFLVLELVEGQTLADQIRTGSIPVGEALKLALQIAEALEAAHEKAVIHRDLKPANIKVTPEGKVKVLDFGLAKAYAGEHADLSTARTATYSPTLSDAATQQGVILGTAAYMSPEQARGKAVDKRADIWAFGCVLYEMLTGQAAFQGEDITEILASVVKGGANLDLLPANLHPRVREVIIRCLQKEQKKRYRDIGEAQYEIDQAMADPSGILMQPITAAEPRTKMRTILPWIAAAIVLTAIIAGVTAWKFKPTEPRQLIRFDYDLPESQQFSSLSYPSLAVSPNGKQFVYSTSNGLYMRSVDELTAKLIAGTEGRTGNPFFSPDGKWIGYFSVGKMKKIPVNGGAPVDLCDARQLWQAWWNEDNTILYGQFARDIMRISADGGPQESIVALKSGGLDGPQILPDGKSILYGSSPNKAQPKIMVQSLKSGETKELFSGFDAHYLPTGHIIYRLPKNIKLFAIPFDPDRLEVRGGGVPIVEGVMSYAVSNSGTLAYIPEPSGGSAEKQTLVWRNREGTEESISAEPNAFSVLRISPDGKRVALLVTSTPKTSIWIWDIARESMTPLAFNEDADNCDPIWTLDSKRIIYTSSRESMFLGKGDIYSKAADGTGEAEKLASLPGRGLFPRSWSKDGKNLVVWEFTASPMNGDIGLISMEGDHVRKPLLQEKYEEKDPQISHDGRWMAYASNESGKYEVYVRPFPDVNTSRCPVSTSGGNTPLWSLNDRELFYCVGDAVMAVPVETEPTFKAGKPTVLFRRTHIRNTGLDLTNSTYWDISPDGKRFLMLKDAVAGGPRKINIVMNWFEELKQWVPPK